MGLTSSCPATERKTSQHNPTTHNKRTPSSSLQPSLQALPSSLSSSIQATKRKLTILHFNDVYNIEEREAEPVGGAARFKTAFDRISITNNNNKPLVLFSGDALAPSNMSVVTMGQQMVPVLNALNVQAAVYGNHDFDFGVDHLIKIAGETNFPWLMTNVLCKHSKRHLAEGKPYHIMDWSNIKIGLIGLVESEWLDTVATINIEDVEYTDYVESAKQYIPILKEMGCELLIALTHMRQPNDRRLLREVPSLHMILGGHDHHYEREEMEGRLLLKSGSDFREFSEIIVTLNNEKIEGERNVSISVKKHTVTKDYPENGNVRNIVETYQQQLNEGMDHVIATLATPLDGQFVSVRTGETNLGNLIADIMRLVTKADVALINSGTLRSDCIHEEGPFKMRDLMCILPMIDSLVVLKINGHQIREALENGVSQYPSLEGRFPQISGMSFMFNPQATSGNRVREIEINGQPLNMEQEYTLCTKSYVADGKDGYTVFKTLTKLINEEEGPLLKTVVINYFTAKGLYSSTVEGESNDSNELLSTSTCSMFDTVEAGDINPQIEGRINICSTN